MRLIDADELKKAFAEYGEKEKFLQYFCQKLIDNAPTVELFCSYLSDGEVRKPCVEGPCEHERPQGEWIDIGNTGACNFCSVCKEFVLSSHHNFCSNCGAQMVKGGAE